MSEEGNTEEISTARGVLTEEELCSKAISPNIKQDVHSLIAECMGNEMFTAREFLVPELETIDSLLVDRPSSLQNELMPFPEYRDKVEKIRELIGNFSYALVLSCMREIAGYKCAGGVLPQTRAALARHYKNNRLAVSDEEAESATKWSRKRKLFALACDTVVEEKIQDVAVRFLRLCNTFVRARQEVLGDEAIKLLLGIFSLPPTSQNAIKRRGAP